MDNSSSKTYRDNGNLYENITTTQIIKYGVVKVLEENTSVLENKGLGRIKVFIKGSKASGGDDGTSDEDLPWCFPLLPKHLGIRPKVGEVVLIFVFNKDKEHVDRLFVGPIISQSPLLEFDPFQFSALAGFTFGPAEPKINPSQISELKGVYPNPEDVSLEGRYNTDITQKKNEIVIRAGKFVETNPTANNPYPFKFNSNSQAYIQLKNDVVIVQGTEDKQEKKGTIANIVANKINLITHSDGSPQFNVTNQDDLIDSDEQIRILQEGHQLVFGDILLEYLKLIKDALLDHVHNGSGNPATDLTISGNKQSLAIFKTKADDLEKSMLSNNIRIN